MKNNYFTYLSQKLTSNILSVLLLLMLLFASSIVSAQTNAPSIKKKVSFQWEELAQSGPNQPASIKSITLDEKVYNLFAMPSSYELTQQGTSASNNKIRQNGAVLITGSNNGSSEWMSKALAAFQSKNLNHYFESNPNGANICNTCFTDISTTSAQKQSLLYNPSIPSNTGGIVAITERNANNRFHIAVYGTPARGGDEQLLGQTFVQPGTTDAYGFGGTGSSSNMGTIGATNSPSGDSDYWLSDRVIENRGTIGIAVFYLNDLAPTGSLISRVQLTADTLDHGDGKFFILQSYAADDEIRTIKNTTILNGNVATNDSPPDNSTYSIVKNPKKGTVTFNTDGSFTYTPESDYVG